MFTSLGSSHEHAVPEHEPDARLLVSPLTDYRHRLMAVHANPQAPRSSLQPRAPRTAQFVQFGAGEPLGHLMDDIAAHIVRVGGPKTEVLGDPDER